VSLPSGAGVSLWLAGGVGLGTSISGVGPWVIVPKARVFGLSFPLAVSGGYRRMESSESALVTIWKGLAPESRGVRIDVVVVV
jgi:hypothetical protein